MLKIYATGTKMLKFHDKLPKYANEMLEVIT